MWFAGNGVVKISSVVSLKHAILFGPPGVGEGEERGRKWGVGGVGVASTSSEKQIHFYYNSEGDEE